MKKLSLFLGLVAAAFIVFAQTTDTRTLSSFDNVRSSEGINVFLSKGTSHSARIEADGIDIEDVLTEVSGDRLEIHLAGGNHRNVDVSVYVTYVNLKALSASSASSIKVSDDVKTSGDFEVKASSAGSIEVSVSASSVDIDVSSSGDVDITVDTDELDAELSSAGDITISGSAVEADISGSSSGDFNGYNFTCEEAELSASSGASIRITVTKDLIGRASSGGSIRYRGDPERVSDSSSSGGSVKKS